MSNQYDGYDCPDMKDSRRQAALGFQDVRRGQLQGGRRAGDGECHGGEFFSDDRDGYGRVRRMRTV